MTTLPLASSLAGDDVTVGEFQASIAQLRNFVFELLGGGGARENIEIIGGIITPNEAVVQIDTEGGAFSDQLDQILPTVLDQKFIVLRCANGSRPITVKNMAAGNGKISLVDNVDCILDSSRKWLWLRYDTSNARWDEVNRNWGLITLNQADETAASVALDLHLGTAAAKNEGPGSTLNADLLDGLDSAVFARKDAANTMSASINMADNVMQRPAMQDEASIAVVENATGNYTADMTRGNVFYLTMTGNVVLGISNPPISGRAGAVTIYFKQDATGGRTLTYPGSVIWPGGVTPTLDTGANKVNVLTFTTVNAGSKWYGHPAGLGFPS